MLSAKVQPLKHCGFTKTRDETSNDVIRRFDTLCVPLSKLFAVSELNSAVMSHLAEAIRRFYRLPRILGFAW